MMGAAYCIPRRETQHYFEDRALTVFIDHKSLTFALESDSDKLNPRRIANWTIPRSSPQISAISMGHAMRCLTLFLVPPSLTCSFLLKRDLAEMTAEQRRELPLNTATPFHRSFVLPYLRRKVFSSLHNLSHPGSRATEKLVSDRFICPGMHKDLKTCIRSFLACQLGKVPRHNNAPIGSFPGTGARFSHVHLDIVGPLSLSNGCSYLFTRGDRFTR
ncbi:unnamed protein product [Schistocephalus solidus]|uniref:Integrase zinc-binding domain-containing protein n=1 Tax=Schistocephalus solidus TaxID=70667 RepID=A0A3P7DDI3_SCHSO|nr:unnamed protein product [Schistocephalus solidus]